MNIRKIISMMDRLFPKSDIIIFNSFPDISDNSFALYRYILLNRKDITKRYNLVWAVSDKTDIYEKRLEELIGGVHHCVIKKKSIKGFFYFLRAKYLITTHGYFGGVSRIRGQRHINLWHGMPLKTIGRGMRQQSSTGFGIDTDLTIATSRLFRDVISFAFGVKKNQVKITGLPRNDLLLEKGHGLHKLGVINKYNKVIMWLPTYRKSVVGDIRCDGDANGLGLKEILLNDFDHLNSILKKNNYLLLIKPHPMDELSKKKLPSSENIITLNDRKLGKMNIPLYSLLADTSVLITDYSSVYIDYLITGNPIAFVFNDFNKYENSRGFVFKDVKSKLPGEIIENKQDFFNYIDNIDSFEGKWKEKYLRIRTEFNPLDDCMSCERVCNVIWKKDI